jgi:hypothetical protein
MMKYGSNRAVFHLLFISSDAKLKEIVEAKIKPPKKEGGTSSGLRRNDK